MHLLQNSDRKILFREIMSKKKSMINNDVFRKIRTYILNKDVNPLEDLNLVFKSHVLK